MPEALIEIAPGAVRALVMQNDVVLEAHLERSDAGPLPGARHLARLEKILVPGSRGIARLVCGTEVLLQPLPVAAEGALVGLEISRMALAEAGRTKLARARPYDGLSGAAPAEIAPGRALQARLQAAGHKLRRLALLGAEDALEAAGWSEVLAEAETGHVRFAGGSLTISLTPAMTVIDVDGALPPAALAEAACVPLALAIRRLGLAGGIVVDFPTLRGEARKALDRQLGAALGQHLASPFEITGINGFGLVQIVRPHAYAGLMEAVRLPGHAALELLRRAARQGSGPATLHGPPAMIHWLNARPALIAEVAKARGGAFGLQAEPGLATSSAYVG